MSRRGGPRLEETQAWVDCVLRAGLDPAEEIRRQVLEAVTVDHPDLDPESTAAALITVATDRLRTEERTWSEPTDHARLQQAFAALEASGVTVQQGCTDHWAARDVLRERPPSRGILWFTPPDVWHAVDAGMLEVNLWHPDTANAAPGDALLSDVLVVFADHGLEAHFDEGRIEVAASWQRRISGSTAR